MYNSLQELLVQPSPLPVFENWIEAAKKAAAKDPVTEGTAMTIATVDRNGQPTARVVLLKGLLEEKILFFTNYNSKKAQDLNTNPNASLSFHWPMLARQILIKGTVKKSSRDISESYWSTRPRGSQISQALSHQSEAFNPDLNLESVFESFSNEYEGKDIPCPEHWGGYLLTPLEIEFWIGKENRLHERVVFTRSESTWQTRPLYP